MVPGRLNLICPQGATFSKVFQLWDKNEVAINVTGYTADMQVRETHSSSDTLVSLTEASGLDLNLNEISVLISYETTSLFPPGKYVWDIEITSPAGKRDRLLEGDFTVTPGITR